MDFRRYPICDTDILVNCCKVNHIEDLFQIYSKINISDAVLQEINYNKEKKIRRGGDFKKEIKQKHFRKTYDYLDKMTGMGQANLIEHHKIDEDKRNVIDSLLLDENIVYDRIKKLYQLNHNIGETVSIIYAAVLNIKIVLSDDFDSLLLAEKFYGLKVIRLETLLKDMGVIDPEKLAEIYVLSKQDDPIEAKEVLDNFKSTNSVDDFIYLKMVDEFKKRHKRNRCD